MKIPRNKLFKTHYSTIRNEGMIAYRSHRSDPTKEAAIVISPKSHSQHDTIYGIIIADFSPMALVREDSRLSVHEATLVGDHFVSTGNKRDWPLDMPVTVHGVHYSDTVHPDYREVLLRRLRSVFWFLKQGEDSEPSLPQAYESIGVSSAGDILEMIDEVLKP